MSSGGGSSIGDHACAPQPATNAQPLQSAPARARPSAACCLHELDALGDPRRGLGALARRDRASCVTTSCSMRSAATMRSSSGAHSSVRTSAHRSSTGVEQRRAGAAAAELAACAARAGRRGARARDRGRRRGRHRARRACVRQPRSAARPGRSPNVREVARARRRGTGARCSGSSSCGSTNASARGRLRSRCARAGRRPTSRFAHREPGVGRPVGEPLAARVLAGEPAPAHVVGPAQHRRRDPRRLRPRRPRRAP